MRSNHENSLIQLTKLKIASYFKSISWVAHSEAKGKEAAVQRIKKTYGDINMFIGDSKIDESAATYNNIPFILCDRYSTKFNINSIVTNEMFGLSA